MLTRIFYPAISSLGSTMRYSLLKASDSNQELTLAAISPNFISYQSIFIGKRNKSY